MWYNGPEVADNTGNLISKTAFDWHNIMRLKAYGLMDIEVGSYWKPQEAQMISTIVKCFQGIQMAKEAVAPDKNGSGNLANNDEHFTRADNAYTRCDMCSNALWRRYY
jgi:hypothetical protein